MTGLHGPDCIKRRNGASTGIFKGLDVRQWVGWLVAGDRYPFI